MRGNCTASRFDVHLKTIICHHRSANIIVWPIILPLPR